MGRVEGKVAFITGAARGQGRSHAVRLAQEGADIIALDICDKVATSVAEPATEADLAETVRLVEEQGRRIIARKADVRDYDALKAVVDEGVAELGRLDVVCANAGMWSYGPYVAAKHGVVGLMKTLAVELAPFSIRSNTVNPSNVDTALILNQRTYDLFRPDLTNPAYEDVLEGFRSMHLLPTSFVSTNDISDAVLFLASDESRYITGVTLSVDAGLVTK